MTVIGESRSLPFAAWCFVEIDDFKLCASSAGGHANHVLFLLGARLEFNTMVTLFVVALGGWNRGDGFPAAALQHDTVLSVIRLTSDPVETGRLTTSASYPKMAVHATLNFLATYGERLILSQEPHCLRRVKLSHRPFDQMEILILTLHLLKNFQLCLQEKQCILWV